MTMKYLSRQNVADMVGLSVSTIARQEATGALPAIRIAGIPRYREDVVREWIGVTCLPVGSRLASTPFDLDRTLQLILLEPIEAIWARIQQAQIDGLPGFLNEFGLGRIFEMGPEVGIDWARHSLGGPKTDKFCSGGVLYRDYHIHEWAADVRLRGLSVDERAALEMNSGAAGS
jgi:predicted DNA-binding transcriptional regulator AlpA